MLTHWKRPWCWGRFQAGGEGDDRDKIVGWHHWLNGHELEQAPGDGRQGSLACCNRRGHKESGMTEWQNDSHKEESNSNTGVPQFDTPIKWADHFREKSNEETQASNDAFGNVNSISRGFCLNGSRIHSFQVLVERSPGYISWWTTKQALLNFRNLKSYEASFHTTTLWD